MASEKRLMRLVLVDWLDSCGCSSSWEDVDEDMKPSVPACRSVGWLAHDGDDLKVIIPHMAENKSGRQGCGDMTIPAVAIRRIVDLAPTTEERKKDG